jgi:hypothetical protein
VVTKLDRLGRWTQQDSLNTPLDPTNGNRYAYAGDDPINGVDPSGLYDPNGCTSPACAIPPDNTVSQYGGCAFGHVDSSDPNSACTGSGVAGQAREGAFKGAAQGAVTGCVVGTFIGYAPGCVAGGAYGAARGVFTGAASGIVKGLF